MALSEKLVKILEYLNKVFEEERSLYHIKNAEVKFCIFKGEKDGESPLKECSNIYVSNCEFSLRYPLWHLSNSIVESSNFTELSRAPFWYSKNAKLINVNCNGVKFLRECKNIYIKDSNFKSEEFGWKCTKIGLDNTTVDSPYVFFGSKNVVLNKFTLSGKYSFQYVKNLTITDSTLNTKDAFWHTENALITDSVIDGEYIGWYSKNLTFINCKIKGTQPFCYAKNLKLINCTLEDADNAFEYTSVNATLNESLISIKNPLRGKIVVDSVGEVIFDEFRRKGSFKLIEKNN